MLKRMRKLDSLKTLIILIFLLIVLVSLIIVTFFFNTAKTMNVYMETAYELKQESYQKEIERQLDRYATAMRVTALNPTVRQNIFRRDVGSSEMIDLSYELTQIINASTYLLANQEYIDRYVFYGDLPTDGRYFAARGNIKNQPWYQDFADRGNLEYHTFTYNYVKGEYSFLMLQTVNDFNTARSGLLSRSACYQVMWVNMNAFFPKPETQGSDMAAYPFLFQEDSARDDGLVYSGRDEYKEYAASVFSAYMNAGKSPQTASGKRSREVELPFKILEVPQMDAYLVLLFDEESLPNFFSGNGILLLIAVLLIFFVIALLMLLIFYINFRRRINATIHLLDSFDEDEPAVLYDAASRNDEIGKIQRHTVKMQNRIKALIEEEYKTKLQNVSAQYEALSANINPHFLYNTLNSIAVTAGMEGAEDSKEMIMALSDLFRYSADMASNQVRLADELKNVQDYLYIQEIRYHRNFVFRVSVKEELMQAKVPKLILQPIVENCFKHGFNDAWAQSDRRNEILISAIHENEFLKIYVMDNGKGMSREEMERVNEILRGEKPLDSAGKRTQSTELGINNVNKRIKLLYKEKCGVEISCAEDQYTCVKLQLLYEEF